MRGLHTVAQLTSVTQKEAPLLSLWFRRGDRSTGVMQLVQNQALNLLRLGPVALFFIIIIMLSLRRKLLFKSTRGKEMVSGRE